MAIVRKIYAKNGSVGQRGFQYAKEGEMIAQGALSMTVSPLLTVEYFIDLADKFIALGAEEICLKDMAGIAGPASVGKIVKGIREKYPNIIIQYHGHSTPGFSVASALESTRNGADIIDVGMEPLSWGFGHADHLTIHAMLKDAGFCGQRFQYESLYASAHADARIY